MEHPQHETPAAETDDAAELHYRELMEQSAAARTRGDHWAAQQLATEAHKWAMDERTRLQRLDQARRALKTATRRLNTTWDRDRECGTIEELQERHPEFKSVITTWEKAQQLVKELENPANSGSAK